MDKREIVVAAVQMTSAVDDVAGNLAHAADLIGAAAAVGAQLVVLPELFAYDYVSFAQRDPVLFARSEPLTGPTVSAMSAAAKAHGVWVVPTLFEKGIAGVGYDTAVLIDPDGAVVGRYRKTHIALMTSPEAGQEKYYFAPGNHLPVFDTPFGTVGILICYDRGFPEAWRVLTLQGAELVVVPITTTDEEGFAAMAQTRCFENGVAGVFVNRCGWERQKRYFGGSLIVGPRGEVLAQAGETEATLVAPLDLAQIGPTRLRMPYLRDRRPDLYGELVARP